MEPSKEEPSWGRGAISEQLRPSVASPARDADAAVARPSPQPARPAQPPAPREQGGSGLTIHSADARIDGRFEVSGAMEIGCQLTGEIDAERLLVMASGRVQANVRVVDAVIRGSFIGDMIATGTVEIEAGGHVNGNITTNQLVLARGAVFRGNVSQLETEPVPVHPVPTDSRYAVADAAENRDEAAADAALVAPEVNQERG